MINAGEIAPLVKKVHTTAVITNCCDPMMSFSLFPTTYTTRGRIE